MPFLSFYLLISLSTLFIFYLFLSCFTFYDRSYEFYLVIEFLSLSLYLSFCLVFLIFLIYYLLFLSYFLFLLFFLLSSVNTIFFVFDFY